MTNIAKVARPAGRTSWRAEPINFLGCLVCTLAVIIPVEGLRAADWSTTGSGSVTGKFDDNIRLSSTDPASDYGIIIRPQLDIHGSNPNWDVNFALALDVARYAQDSSLDSEDPSLRLDSSYRTQLSEFGLEAEVSRTTSLITEETDAGNFTSNTDRDLLSLAPSWSYIASPRDTLNVGASVTDVNFRADTFTDHRTLEAHAGWAREVTTADVVSLNFVVEHIESESTIEIESELYDVLVGWDRTFSERLRTSLAAGPQYYTTEEPRTVNGSVQTTDEDTFGFRLSAGVEYRPSEVTELDVGFTHEVSASSSGSPLERDTLEATASHRFLPRLSGSLSTLFQLGRDPNNSDSDRDFFSLQPSLTYELAMEWDVSASYRFRTQDSEGSDRAYSNAIFATVTYRPLR